MAILASVIRFLVIDLVTRRHVVVSGWSLLDASHVAAIELGSTAIRCLELGPLPGAIEARSAAEKFSQN